MKPADTAREIAEALYDLGRMPLTDAKHREASVAIGVERIMRLVVAWRPIETAPQGEALDVWVPVPDLLAGGCRVPDVRWSSDEQAWCDEDGVPLVYPPTHWMREPPAPEGA